MVREIDLDGLNVTIFSQLTPGRELVLELCETMTIEFDAHAAKPGEDVNVMYASLTYDSTCVNVTNWERNTTNLMGKKKHYDGSEWITFSTMDLQPPLLNRGIHDWHAYDPLCK